MNIELNKRICFYKKKMKDYVVKFYSFIFLISLVVSFAFFWILSNDPKEHLPVDWRILAFVFAIVTAIPPFFVFAPDRPTAGEVRLDSLINENTNFE